MIEQAIAPDAGGSDAAADTPAQVIGLAESDRLAETFKAMADPTRVRILHALTLAELPVCDLAALVQTSESAVSHQLGLLRARGIVRRRKTGRHVFYTLDDDHIRHLIEQGLAHQAHQLAQRNSDD